MQQLPYIMDGWRGGGEAQGRGVLSRKSESVVQECQLTKRSGNESLNPTEDRVQLIVT